MMSLIWGVAEFCLAIKTRSKSGTKSKDRGSVFVIWLVCGFSVWLGISLAGSVPALNFPARHQFYLAGYALFLCGVAFRWYAIFYLGRFFTPDVAILHQHRLIDTGPYRFIRHPTYTGALVGAFGLTITLGNLVPLLVIFIPVTAVILWRIKIEEAALVEAFGDQYRSYMQRTNRLFPFIY